MINTWEQYDRWNTAIADIVFPLLDVPQPVYLDLEDDVAQVLGERMGLEPAVVLDRLCGDVSGTLTRGAGPTTIFQHHTQRMTRWIRRGRKDVPPFLALLAVFCIAAEKMAAGDGMGATNYFGRLRETVDWAPKDKRLEQGYRRIAERFWSEHNRWLVGLDGARGLPTAFALNYRYVGLSLSQALVRSADRERLKDFFRKYGFAPGADVAPAELALVLDDWIASKPSPVSATLHGLWKGSARDRIAQAVAVSLSAWDGSVRHRDEAGSPREAGSLVLTLELGGFPKKKFALSALVYAPEPNIPRSATVLTAKPQATIELIPDLPGALGLGRGSSLHAGDALEGVVRIEDSLSKKTLERRPRRLLLFREDDLSRRWIESPQVMLGDSVRLLVQDNLVERLEKVLERIARPGWSVAKPYPGQPEGWSVLTDVEVFSQPGDLVDQSRMDDLLPLVPLTRSQMKVAGGFALPGRVRGKWHAWAPPEIRAISDAPNGFTVRLIDTHRFAEADEDLKETCIAEWSDHGAGVIVQSLAHCGIADGDYRAELWQTGDKQPLTTTSIILRSSDTPDTYQWSNIDPVGYAEGAGVTGLHIPGGRSEVKGHVVPDARTPTKAQVTVPSRPTWEIVGSASVARTSTLRITVPEADSCIRTGAHREQIDTVEVDSKGKPLQKWSYGRCKGCGLVRRYPTRLKWSSFGGAKSGTESDSAPIQVDLGSLPPAAHSQQRDWATAFDALLHTGGGTWSQFERIALQIEPTALFVDHMARTLESLGHIDVRRDPTTMQPSHWEVCPTALVATEEDYLFAGFWPNELYTDVSERLDEQGIRMSASEAADVPAQYFVAEATLPGEARELLNANEVMIIDSPWNDLVSFLPPLSAVLAGLPRQSSSLVGDISWFDTRTARWVKATSFEAPGAYRVQRFSMIDFVRSEDDVKNQTVARSTVQLSKHIAAMLEGQPLLAYDQACSALLVPLGADMPGLYGRAAVAASGLPPVQVSKSRILKYEGVPEELALHLYDLMSR